MTRRTPGCEPFREDLTALLDGELEAARAAQVEAHLAGCSACRAELAELRRVADALRALPTPRVPETLLARTRVRIEAQAGAAAPGAGQRDRAPRARAPRRSRRGWLPWAAAGAVAAAAVAAVWIVRPVGEGALEHERGPVVADARPAGERETAEAPGPDALVATPDAGPLPAGPAPDTAGEPGSGEPRGAPGTGAPVLAERAAQGAGPEAGEDPLEAASEEELELAAVWDDLAALEEAGDLELVEQLELLERLDVLDERGHG